MADDRGPVVNRILWVVRIITMIASGLVIAMNIYVLTQLNRYAFKGYTGNTMPDQELRRIFYAIMRGFNILFGLIIILSALPPSKFLQKYYFKYLLVFKSFFACGMLQVFVGVMSLDSTLGATEQKELNKFSQFVGFVLVAVGILHLLLSFCIFREWKADSEYEDTKEKSSAEAHAASSVPPHVDEDEMHYA